MWEVASLKGKYFCEPKTWNYKLSMSVSKRVFESFGDSTVEPVRGTLRMASCNFALRDRKKTPRNLGWAKFGPSGKPSEPSCEPFWTLADASGDILEVFSAIFVRLQVRRPGFILFSRNYDTILVPKLRRKWFRRGKQKSSGF